MNILFRIADILLFPVIRLIFRAKQKGKENIPKSGPVIIAANHLHAFDMFFISTFSRRSIRFLAKAELFRNPFGRLIFRGAGAIPINRAAAGVESVNEVISSLEKGEAVGIFPQGTRLPRKNPAETKIKSGIGLIAYHAKATVLPVFIGAKGMKIRPFRKTEVRFGKPIAFDELGFENGGIDEYRHASEIIFEKICELGKDISSSAEEKQ